MFMKITSGLIFMKNTSGLIFMKITSLIFMKIMSINVYENYVD